MADERRTGSSRGVPRRNGQGRKIATRSAIPRWAYGVLIAVPGVLIVLLLILKATRSDPSEAAVAPVDANAKISALVADVKGLREGYAEAQKLLRAEDPRAKDKVEMVSLRIERWMQEWDELFEKHRDADGKLPSDLADYGRTRSEVNTLRLDLIKISGF